MMKVLLFGAALLFSMVSMTTESGCDFCAVGNSCSQWVRCTGGSSCVCIITAQDGQGRCAQVR